VSGDKATQEVGLIGWPVAHSVSPAMFDAAFAALGLNWTYEIFPIQPKDVRSGLQTLRERGLHGFNVTVPHKSAIIPYLNTILPEAKTLGAVNTVTAVHEKTTYWEGTNTDIDGFQHDLLAHIRPPRPGAQALVLGAGGAARAAVYVLARLGFQVLIASRNPAHGLDVIRAVQAGLMLANPARGQIESTQWRMQFRTLPFDRLHEIKNRVDLIVNCTPVGMWPHVDESPWPDKVPLPLDATVYDMVYRPARTRLLRQAEAAGLVGISGLGMLVRQGAAAFRRWTGLEAPYEIMFNAARQMLEA
jgi:shikimate dehydrogenase